MAILGAVSMADNILFFTELVGMPVFDLKNRRLGRVRDAAWCPWCIPRASTVS